MNNSELVSSKTESGTVEVRIRHVLDANGKTLGWFPADGLQRLIDTILLWGIYDDDGNATSSLSGIVSGNFVLNTDVFFEIIIDPDVDE